MLFGRLFFMFQTSWNLVTSILSFSHQNHILFFIQTLAGLLFCCESGWHFSAYQVLMHRCVLRFAAVHRTLRATWILNVLSNLNVFYWRLGIHPSDLQIGVRLYLLKIMFQAIKTCQKLNIPGLGSMVTECRISNCYLCFKWKWFFLTLPTSQKKKRSVPQTSDCFQ